MYLYEAMVESRSEGRGSFIAGPSTHNQRIECLWQDVFRCVCHFFYYLFYGMEDSGVLNITNPSHMFALHFVFLPSPFENSDNVVVVPPVNMENVDVIQSERLQIIDALMPLPKWVLIFTKTFCICWLHLQTNQS